MKCQHNLGIEGKDKSADYSVCKAAGNQQYDRRGYQESVCTKTKTIHSRRLILSEYGNGRGRVVLPRGFQQHVIHRSHQS